MQYNIMNVVFGQIEADCTPHSCPQMSAGKSIEYLWRDETDKASKPVNLPAKEYINKTIDWIKTLLDDEDVFPSSKSACFPVNLLLEHHQVKCYLPLMLLLLYVRALHFCHTLQM